MVLTPYSKSWFLAGVLAVLLTSLAFTSCCSDEKEEQQRAIAMHAIDDSLRIHSHAARSIIDRGMRQASDSATYYEWLSRLAKYYVLSPSPDSTLLCLDRIERYARNREDDRSKMLLAYAYNTRAGYYHNFHRNTGESIALYTRAYELTMSSHHPEQAPDVCANLGDAYFYENRLPKAASCYRRALYLADSLRMPERQQVTLYMGLATIYQSLDDYQRAGQLYKKCEDHFDDMSASMQSYFLNNYASYYYYCRDYARSYRLFRQLESHIKRVNMADNFDMYLCRLNLADVCLNLDKTDSAEILLDEVEPFWKKQGDYTAQYYCTSIRLGIAVKKKDWPAAAVIAEAHGSQQEVLPGMRRIRNRYLRRYYVGTGEWKNAYYNIRGQIMEEDSIDEKNMNMRSADIVSQFVQDTLRLHNDLAMEQKNAEVVRTRLWLALTIGLTLLMLLVLVLFLHYTRQHRLQAEMDIIKLRLESARSKISPHFIFNVLNNQIADADSHDAKRLLDISKLIRANLDLAGQMTATLAQEMDFVRKYVNVEKELLVDGDFEYIEDLQPGLEPEKLVGPSMFTQIMVENAFVHALMGRTGHKQLTLRVRSDSQGTTVSVIDNGPGFSIAGRHKKRTGLNIIAQSMAVFNRHNKHKMTFDMHNIKGNDGKIKGCEACLYVPHDFKYPGGVKRKIRQ